MTTLEQQLIQTDRKKVLDKIIDNSQRFDNGVVGPAYLVPIDVIRDLATEVGIKWH